MKIKKIPKKDKESFNKLASHPLQSFEWGEFKEATGMKVYRFGAFKNQELKEVCTLFFRPLPKLPFSVGYVPRGIFPNEDWLPALRQVGKKENAIFIKFEPNIYSNPGAEELRKQKNFLREKGLRRGKDLLPPYNFILDITQNQEALLSQMKSKTRYNIRLAQRKEVKIEEDHSTSAFETYLRLLFETQKRQGFFAHTREYHRLLWETLKGNLVHLLVARYENEILATLLLLTFGDYTCHLYAASTRKHKEVMAPNLLLWEGIKLGKRVGCKYFDTGGSLGPNPDPKHPWFGFHHFKEGYGGELQEYVGSWDLVLHPKLYRSFLLADKIRFGLLRMRRALVE